MPNTVERVREGWIAKEKRAGARRVRESSAA